MICGVVLIFTYKRSMTRKRFTMSDRQRDVILAEHLTRQSEDADGSNLLTSTSTATCTTAVVLRSYDNYAINSYDRPRITRLYIKVLCIKCALHVKDTFRLMSSRQYMPLILIIVCQKGMAQAWFGEWISENVAAKYSTDAAQLTA